MVGLKGGHHTMPPLKYATVYAFFLIDYYGTTQAYTFWRDKSGRVLIPETCIQNYIKGRPV